MTREEAMHKWVLPAIERTWNDRKCKEIIKALEQEPCEDAISRQEAVEAFQMFREYESNRNNKGWVDRIETVLNQLPPVTPQPKIGWIPVSERLPEEDGFYLATCDGEICGEDEPFSGLAEFENGKWVDDEEDYQFVLAWMPLPEPYDPQESEVKE